jgi:hypothetical protein
VSAAPAFDPVQLASSTVDFGNGGLLPSPIDDPISFGVFDWDTSNGTVTPRLTGEMYLTDAQGMPARMYMSYYDVFGTRLAVKHSTASTALNNGTFTRTIDMAPYDNPAIYKVVVWTAFNVGSDWIIQSSRTVYI